MKLTTRTTITCTFEMDHTTEVYEFKNEKYLTLFRHFVNAANLAIQSADCKVDAIRTLRAVPNSFNGNLIRRDVIPPEHGISLALAKNLVEQGWPTTEDDD